MDRMVHQSPEPSPFKDEKVEPGELLENRWFFGNFLDRKTRMLRSFSDPTTSSNYSQEIVSGKSYEETYNSIKKLPGNDDSRQSNFIRAPSMPPSLERKDQRPTDPGRKKSDKKTSSKKLLLRAPSLPSSLGPDEFQDEETEFSMGKLIRQASMNNSDIMPARTHAAAKGISTSYRRNPEIESVKLEGPEKIRRPPPPHIMNQLKTQKSLSKLEGLEKMRLNQLKTQKSLSDLEWEELQGFKDLGFDFNEKDLSPHVISIIPGLQEKKRVEENDFGRRPYLSEAWRSQSSALPVPRWGGKRSTEDMKAQIKFWARAVASNVRQEC